MGKWKSGETEAARTQDIQRKTTEWHKEGTPESWRGSLLSIKYGRYKKRSTSNIVEEKNKKLEKHSKRNYPEWNRGERFKNTASLSCAVSSSGLLVQVFYWALVLILEKSWPGWIWVRTTFVLNFWSENSSVSKNGIFYDYRSILKCSLEAILQSFSFGFWPFLNLALVKIS